MSTVTRYAAYDALGNITQILQGVYHYKECAPDVSDDTHFFNKEAGEFESKAPLNYEVDTDDLSVTITGLPTGLSVMSQGFFTTTDDDATVIKYDVPGTYRIELSGGVEYLGTALEVTVGDP